MTRALVAPLALLVALTSCGGGDEGPTRIESDTLTIYSSVPSHGFSASAGEAVYLGQQRALREAGARAAGRRVRLVRLSSTRPEDSLWDPGTVEANAERAGDDPSAIAYLGELDYGGSAISLPVTNRAGLLQISPTDGLTSLTRTPPGRPRAGPERYYPKRSRTFLRLVPSDLALADQLLRLLDARSRRSLAVIHGDGIADRELAAVLVNRLRREGGAARFVESLPRDDDDAAGLVERLAASRPRVVVYLGAPTKTTRATLTVLARRLPDVRVLGSAGVALPSMHGRPVPREMEALTTVLPAAAQPPAGRRLLRSLGRERGTPVREEALYGYASMSLALAAIDQAGPDRGGVARAAAATLRQSSVLGPLRLAPGREPRPERFALLDLGGGARRLERIVRRGGVRVSP